MEGFTNEANLEEIVDYLDSELNTAQISDYAGAMNGLQLVNSGRVTKVGAAVDASLAVIEKAIAEEVDLLVVHHGLFWQGAQKIVGAQYKKLKLAMDANMAIYSSHIPLDVHPEFGNNALLCASVGMTQAEKFHEWKGLKLGLKQKMELTLDALIERVENSVQGDVHVCRGRNAQDVGVVGVITGGAGSEVQAMADAGVETFITGEGPHWSYPLAEELGINVIYAGHYNTETFGVRALADHLASKYLVGKFYINHPTGL